MRRKSERSAEVECCIRAAVAAAKAAIRAGRTESVHSKADPFVRHHAVFGEADLRACDALLKVIARHRPGAWCLTEEWTGGSRPGVNRLTSALLQRLKREGVFIADELDGSSAFTVGHYEWSTSVAYVEAMQPKAAAICAPDVWKGAVFFAGQGVNGIEALDGSSLGALQVRDARLQDAYMLVGPDLMIHKYSALMQGVLPIANLARTTNIINSCALGMALIAAGRANVLIEPPQRPWDWAAGRTLIESAGGVVLFYRMQAGQFQQVKRPVVRDYDPKARALGFVAGPRRLAEAVLGGLEKSLPHYKTDAARHGKRSTDGPHGRRRQTR